MNKHIKGFTLVEILVYVSIFAVVVGLMVGILTVVLKVQQKESGANEAASQLNFVMQTIQRLVKESSAIIVNASAGDINNDAQIGTSQPRLVLRMKDSGNNPSADRDPIIIYAENGKIKMSEGDAQRISDLTNDRVIADNLQFTKFTQYPGHDTVSIDIQLTYNSDNQQSRVTRTLRTAIARVSAATFDSNLLPGADNQYEVGYTNYRWKNISVSNLLNLGQSLSDPIGAQEGSIYYNTTNKVFRGYASSTWSNLGESLWTATSTGIYYPPAGSNNLIGIGTVNPSAKLHIDYSAASALSNGVAFIDNRGANNISALKIGDSTLDPSRYILRAVNDSDGDGGGPYDIFAIKADGNVGIGTTNPKGDIHIGAGFGATINDNISANADVEIWHNAYVDDASNRKWINGPSGNFGSRGIGFGYAGTTAGITFYADSAATTADVSFTPTARMIIQNTGNIGIGTTTPESTLDVVGTVSIFRTPASMTLETVYTADTDLLFMCNLAGGSFTYLLCDSADYRIYSQNALPAVNQAGCTAFAKKGETYKCSSPGMSGSSFGGKVYKLGR